MPRVAHNGLLSADPFLALLRDARITRSSVIRVTGASGLSALLWLCRHGFEHAGYVKSVGGAPHENADALIVAHTCDARALESLLVDGPHVRPGGVLILRSPLIGANDGADPIHALLEAHGYGIERRLHGHHRELHVARRREPVLSKAA
jgi:hypothetical protein